MTNTIDKSKTDIDNAMKNTSDKAEEPKAEETSNKPFDVRETVEEIKKVLDKANKAPREDRKRIYLVLKSLITAELRMM